MRKHLLIVAAILGAFALGFTASDMITTKRLTVFNDAGDAVVSLGVDQAGAGYLVVRDEHGATVLAVQHGEVTIPNAPSPDSPPAPVAADSDAVMQITLISPAPVDTEKLARAEKLQKQADRVRSELKSLERSLAGLKDAADKDAVRARVAQKSRLAAQLRSNLRSLSAQAERLRREARETRQIIEGTDGVRDIRLVTTRDLTPLLTRIGPSGWCTWKGQLVGLEGDWLKYEIVYIEPVAEP